ncbi:alpha/beta hydrolase fold domain-containing protein [Actinocorallia populi]|uniref:alpha/beta hydrolase fold domain-containing protein n=1 Tax=Actinocorallia populi TaxID=2079200 RepID=UPI0018E52C4C|nr:alpha/beta hydrolase [Actinocorallia populi]
MANEVQVETSRTGLVVRPPDPAEMAVLYLHGDSSFSGEPEQALEAAEHLSLRTGATVVCARYRPVFPSALVDVQTAYHYSQAMGPVAVAGEGAGAGLAAALLIRLRDAGSTLPSCATLVSPLLDLSLQAPSLLFNASANPEFDLAELRARVGRYAADRDLTDPFVSPLHGNLHGLPPVQLLTSGTDPLLDDALAFAARAAHSSVSVDLHVHPDATGLHAETIPSMAAFIRTQTPAAVTRTST